MSESKRWQIGTGIAITGILLTIFGFWLDGRRKSLETCEVLKLELMNKVAAFETQESARFERERRISVLEEEQQRLERRIEKANQYFDAQEEENSVAILSQTILDAEAMANHDYDHRFFSRPTQNGRNVGDIWIEYLKQAGFPPNPTATRTLVREFLRLGLDDTAANQIALGVPADQRTVNYVVEKLRELERSLERKRDQNYSPEFQGVGNRTEIVGPLSQDFERIEEQLSSVYEKQSDGLITGERLEREIDAICNQVSEKGCDLHRRTNINCREI
ncbi:hypothetical protein [Vreelandella venusta]|uniref:hypothetical protein n=1 Tax=Vreelandella venusta TaxID=44935 RepID=UPI0018DAEBA2|nr:hypothetical protein [Halomonas venusta]QPI62580.1 hypothetical protein IR195_11825 [Halomonas venusta]